MVTNVQENYDLFNIFVSNMNFLYLNFDYFKKKFVMKYLKIPSEFRTFVEIQSITQGKN